MCNSHFLQTSIFTKNFLKKYVKIGATKTGLLLFLIIFFSSTGFVYAEYYPDIQYEEDFVERYTRPTFGLDYETNEQQIDDGFRINGRLFDITNNFHTPFEEQTIEIGKINSFETSVFAPKGLKVQEFLFGIPKIGDAHLAEMRVEVWYHPNGNIKNFKVFQNSEVIDSQHIIVKHEKTKCRESDAEENCDLTRIGLIFRESLKDKVMAIKGIDFENRYQITYLNEGFEISGDSLNSRATRMIPSPERNEGLIQVTQSEKYSPLWIAEDGRIFEQNNFGSFTEKGIKFERFQDDGEPRTRLHSEFGGLIEKEQEKALHFFNSTKLISELPDSYTIDIIIEERMGDKLKEKMLEQEAIAKKIIEESFIQARF